MFERFKTFWFDHQMPIYSGITLLVIVLVIVVLL